MSNGLVRVSVVIPAAGIGSRMGDSPLPKQFMELRGKPLLDWTIEAVSLSTRIDEVVLVVREQDIKAVTEKYVESISFPKVRAVVVGGLRRTDSVLNGVTATSNEWVAVHDAARPFVSVRLIELTINAALKHEAAAAAMPVADTVAQKSGLFLGGLVDRDAILLIQTPQVFRKKLLVAAYESMKNSANDWTDETSLLKAAGHKVAWVNGERTNIKITAPEDLPLADAIAATLT
ncbi:MAG: 2-C-methyl-D-erythritol 4-phosphate cytidylyltransferase [Nitrospinota bacterium]